MVYTVEYMWKVFDVAIPRVENRFDIVGWLLRIVYVYNYYMFLLNSTIGWTIEGGDSSSTLSREIIQ